MLIKGKDLTQKQLDEIWNDLEFREKFNVSRFQIIDQKLYADSFSYRHRYFRTLINYLNELVKKYKIQDVDFMVYLRDELHYNNGLAKKTLEFPGFLMSKNLDSEFEKDQLLIPDAFILETKWAKLIHEIEQENKESNWKEKENKIYWRGGPTGANGKNLDYNIKNFNKLPRLSLVMLSKLYPEKIDAKFVGNGEFSDDKSGNDLRSIINILFGEKQQRVDEVDHLNFKYLISVDGNTCTWRRVPWIMLSNSVLIKQESSNVEWFYSAIKPYVHYVPVKNDISDVFSKLDWLKENDQQLKAISENASKFVEENLMPEDIESYMVIILNQYHHLLAKQKLKATLSPAEKLISYKDKLKAFLN